VTEPNDLLVRRAERLLRWYPKTWRRRYGAEFSELLVAELDERPRSWKRAADVAWNGLVARMTAAGLTDHTIEPSDQVRASLASLGASLGVFSVFAVAIWAQLAVSWQWSSPPTEATYGAMILMSATMAVFLVLTVLAALPIGFRLVCELWRRRSGELVRPSLLMLTGAVFLVLGARHFAIGWPGSGGRPWSLRGLVPGNVAAFSWASTLSVSSYWAHPRALASFPTLEVAWMAMSPLAIFSVVAGLVKMLRRVVLTPRVLRYEAGLGRLAALAMVAFLLGSCAWVIDGVPGPRNLFHTGAIDVAGILAMAMAVAVGHRASRRTRSLAVTLTGR
jgi:hypothetical protein